ncbi:eukaryotic translation initiation factor 1b-like [Lepus europaeus]|uniref:eukaryotic translation initiation factor 1b-like n=1 Tax=Lepus europaeus TaxID=9983 RepID=UPI002B46D04F|nr:eukaryotic translation initiation factor 1b-like [Lepus europaeus]
MHLGAGRAAEQPDSSRDSDSPSASLLQATSTKEKESYHISTTQDHRSFDPFAEASTGDALLPAATEDNIQVRIQHRNGRKTLSTVTGITDDYKKKKPVKVFKKKFACNGTVVEHPEHREVIHLQGDQCKNICQFLVETGLVKDNQLKVCGF